MDTQQIIALVLGAVALFFVGRHVWAEVRGLIFPSEAGGCPGCGGCDAANAENSRVRPAPQIKKTPLLTLSPSRPVKLPDHLANLRRDSGQQSEDATEKD